MFKFVLYCGYFTQYRKFKVIWHRGDMQCTKYYFIILVITIKCVCCCCAGHKQRNPIKWIIDVTIGYPERDRPLDLPGIIFGARQPCQIAVHYRHFRTDSIPCDHEELLHWLYDRWAEKDELLEHFYQTGAFPVSPSDPPAARLLALSDARCILINTFLAVSAWFAIRIICAVCCVLLDLVFG